MVYITVSLSFILVVETSDTVSVLSEVQTQLDPSQPAISAVLQEK